MDAEGHSLLLNAKWIETATAGQVADLKSSVLVAHLFLCYDPI